MGRGKLFLTREGENCSAVDVHFWDAILGLPERVSLGVGSVVFRRGDGEMGLTVILLQSSREGTVGHTLCGPWCLFWDVHGAWLL